MLINFSAYDKDLLNIFKDHTSIRSKSHKSNHTLAS